MENEQTLENTCREQLANRSSTLKPEANAIQCPPFHPGELTAAVADQPRLLEDDDEGEVVPDPDVPIVLVVRRGDLSQRTHGGQNKEEKLERG